MEAILVLLALALAVPGYALAYLLRRRQRSLERRSRLLGTAVEVSHAVDAFFVAIADPSRTRLSYRFLVDDSRELEPTERELVERADTRAYAHKRAH